MEPIDHLTRDAAHRLGEGIPSAQVARQRRQVDWMYRKLQTRSDLRRWWAVPAALAAVVALAWFTSVVPRPRQMDSNIVSTSVASSASEPQGPSQAVPSDTPRTALPRHEPLIAKLAAQTVSPGSALHAGRAASTLEFSDHSQVTLAPETDARLALLDAERVHVELERGRLELSVTPRGQRTWMVAAGPYTVEVTGTVFAVTWQPPEQGLSVDVTTGSVWVHGADLGNEGVRLSAGQHQIFGSPAETATTPDCRGLGCGGGGGGGANARPGRTARWRELAKRGEHAAALVAAQREGFTALVERLGPEDLDGLAQSARVARALEPAREALQALRRRFPAHTKAQEAAFVLGRVASELAGDTRGAAGWFETYLREQPRGELAAQARGRLMEIWNDLGDTARAQEVARDYLRRHADGENAGLARRTLDAR